MTSTLPNSSVIRLIPFIACVFIAGCATGGRPAAYQIIPTESVSDVDLVSLIAGSDASSCDTNTKMQTSAEIHCAINVFYQSLGLARPSIESGSVLGDTDMTGPEEASDEDLLKLYRNRIQDRLLFASQHRCEEYISGLQAVAASENFWVGSTTTLLATAGAIINGERSTQILSGLAGLSSGIDAKYKESFFSNLAIQVLTPAIRQRRFELLDKINSRQLETIRQYTLERALGDASEYHGACSVIAGLETATEAVGQSLTQARENTKRIEGILARINQDKPGEVTVENLEKVGATNQEKYNELLNNFRRADNSLRDSLMSGYRDFQLIDELSEARDVARSELDKFTERVKTLGVW